MTKKIKKSKKDKTKKEKTKGSKQTKILSQGAAKILRNKKIIQKINDHKEKIKNELKNSTKDAEGSKLEEKNDKNNSQNEEDRLAMEILGFTSFSSTKNKNHSKTNVDGFYKASVHHRKYRQYMNRKGGYNRPLENT